MHRRILKKRRQARVRGRVRGTAMRPRINVFRSLNEIYVQLIDDDQGKTLVSASSKEIKSQDKKTVVANEVGKLAASKAVKAGVTQAVFDRAGYQYHGRVKSLAEGLRAGGVKF